ncbi:UNVERIFIED_CONTAM: hypothetical protein HDU68_002457 [Siphonaria sp. JEL0065]|nr:hypothetical protein HDU68_002457 [Siphonaria sp. JEL0065]
MSDCDDERSDAPHPVAKPSSSSPVPVPITSAVKTNHSNPLPLLNSSPSSTSSLNSSNANTPFSSSNQNVSERRGSVLGLQSRPSQVEVEQNVKTNQTNHSFLSFEHESTLAENPHLLNRHALHPAPRHGWKSTFSPDTQHQQQQAPSTQKLPAPFTVKKDSAISLASLPSGSRPTPTPPATSTQPPPVSTSTQNQINKQQKHAPQQQVNRQFETEKFNDDTDQNTPDSLEVNYGVDEEKIIVGDMDAPEHLNSFNSGLTLKLDENVGENLMSTRKCRSLTDFVMGGCLRVEPMARLRFAVVGNEESRKFFRESAFFGLTLSNTSGANDSDSDSDNNEIDSTGSFIPRKPRKKGSAAIHRSQQLQKQQQVHINMSIPFSILLCGSAKTGKTHTASTLLENCLLPTFNKANLPDAQIINTYSPMCALVLHYSHAHNAICPFVNLIKPITHVSLENSSSKIPTLPETHLVVLVSPATFVTRRELYKSICAVRPLLFSWDKLSPHQIKMLMKLNTNNTNDDSATAAASILHILDTYSSQGEKQSFHTFLATVKQILSAYMTSTETLQSGLTLLETFTADSSRNRYRHPTDFTKLIKKGILVIADLTDSAVLKSENHWELEEMGVEDVEVAFRVLVDMFEKGGGSGSGQGGGVCRKVLVLDNVDLYSRVEEGGDRSYQGRRKENTGIVSTVLEIASKSTRSNSSSNSNGTINVLMGTRDPRCLTPDAIELASLVVMHRIGSKSWFDYLKGNGCVLRESEYLGMCSGLSVGEVVLYAGNHGMDPNAESKVWKVQVRPKLTG